jgi:hypothetical protein
MKSSSKYKPRRWDLLVRRRKSTLHSEELEFYVRDYKLQLIVFENKYSPLRWDLLPKRKRKL